MNNFLIAILIGLVAGIIDVVPMIIQKLDKGSCLSAFVHYFAVSGFYKSGLREDDKNLCWDKS